MSEKKIELKVEFPVNSNQLYNDWLDSKAHSLFTGGEAKISAKINTEFTCWDGYISGKIMELEPGKRILHTWRTTEFNEQEEDSLLEILFEDTPSGNTLLTLNHWNLSEPNVEKYKSGWLEHYFEPMKRYYR